MGLVVRTNGSAINSNRNLKKNTKKNKASMEKLASGYRINRAGDDASGLAISEKMKAQITALGTADNNCEDGISLIQTAEGYMEEIHNILNRMVELSEKSANGILEDSGNRGYRAYGELKGKQNAGTDRAALQSEMDQLCAEIDRIAMTANFNGNKLFYPEDGPDYDAYNKLPYINASYDLPNDTALQIGETANKADKLVIHFPLMSTDGLFLRSHRMDHVDVINADGAGVTQDQLLVISNNKNTLTDHRGVVQSFKGKSSANEFGVTVNISDQAFASKAAEIIRDVIDDVSLYRSQFGAAQNRLEYTINNLNTTEENITAANSRIRDTEMAEEMSEYTKSNIVSQAAQAMLAQANTQPQNVLSLLQ